MFREDKAAAVASFFAEKIGQGEINDLDLMKLMYFSERRSLEENTTLMTGDVFVNMPFGPVLSHTYDCMKGEIRTRVWSSHFAPLIREKHSIAVKDLADFRAILADWELDLLEAVWTEHGAKHKWSKVSYAHSDKTPEWKNPAPYKVRELTLEAVFEKGFGREEDTATENAALVKNVEGLRNLLS